MESACEILVLIANDRNAILCTNSEGVTRLLRAMEFVSTANDKGHGCDTAKDTRNIFACELMMTLCRGMGDHVYDGVVIFAEERMMGALREVQTVAVSQALIAEIVGKPSDIDCFLAVAGPMRGRSVAGQSDDRAPRPARDGGQPPGCRDGVIPFPAMPMAQALNDLSPASRSRR